jgi:hypothetical protein
MMLPVKPYVYRSWSISFAGPSVYAPHHRAQWLGKITQAGVRRRAELLCQQLDGLQALRQTARHDLLAESRNGRSARSLYRSDSGGSVDSADPERRTVSH